MAVATGDRRIVSVLVADVGSSTTIAEELGPERSKFLFDEVVRLMSHEVRRFGGTVAQLTGDGLLALFGAPEAHEDDPARAVRSALALQEVLSNYGREVEEAYGVEVQARVAVNTGLVVIPDRDATPEVLYNALGDTVNVAARLQEAAGPGGVAVGPETARQVEGVFTLESLGDLQLKGKREPVAASRVLGILAIPAPVHLQPLIGRAAELEQLCNVLDRLVDGRGAIVSISGQPGIGKTRLAAEAFERYELRARFLTAHCTSYATGVPYAPLRELLRSWLGLGLTDPEARLRLELKAELERLLGTAAADAYLFLANLLGLSLEPDSEQRLRDYARDSVKLQTHEAVFSLVRALAAERPSCLLLEDLHWADEPTLELVEELLPLTDQEALCLVLMHRADPDQPSRDLSDRARRQYRHRYLEIELAPLSPEETAELVGGSAGAQPSGQLASLLADRTGGNPLFIEEVVRDLLERGALERENGTLGLAQGADAVVPTLIQEALQARLDRLAAETREIVALAAVAGRSFSLPLLERLASKEQLLPALSELQRLELVVEERRRPALEYRFSHGLVQEAAYGALTSAGKRALHRRVGAALEELVAAEPERAYPALARHFATAEEPAKAADYLLKAGDAARRIYADEEAVSHYRLALPFLDRLGQTARARGTLFKIALTHHLAFEFERANAAWEEAFARPEPPVFRLEPTERLEVEAPAAGPLLPHQTLTVFDWWLVPHLFRGLLAVDSELNVVPQVASTFEVSADGLRYRFRLREGSRWSDATDVAAEDFSSAWKATSAEHAPMAHLLDDIAFAEPIDSRTLEVRLREPRNYFLYIFSAPPAFPRPRHQAETFVGNGPFVLADSGERHFVLRSSATWLGAHGNVGEAHLSIRGIGRPVETWLEHRPDVLLPVLRKAPPGLDDTVVESFGWGVAYLGFRSDRRPFDDRRVRAAFAYAIDRDRLFAAAYDWSAEPAGGGIVPPQLPGHSHRLVLEHDLELARRLLSEAAYPDGHELRVRLVAPEYTRDEVVGELVAQLASLGADVEAIRPPIAKMVDAIREGADLWLWDYSADYPDPDGVLSSLLQSYPALRTEAETHRLLRSASSTRDQDERVRLYREVDSLLVKEHVALVPIAYTQMLLFRRPWIEGFSTTPFLPATLDEVIVRRPS
jgi:ABC-type transport system substrate-binding protein/class 3 adenylate cyclase